MTSFTRYVCSRGTVSIFASPRTEINSAEATDCQLERDQMVLDFTVVGSSVRRRFNCGPDVALANPQIESLLNCIVWAGVPLSSWKLPRLGDGSSMAIRKPLSSRYRFSSTQRATHPWTMLRAPPAQEQPPSRPEECPDMDSHDEAPSEKWPTR